MLIAHISDMHVTPKGRLAYGRVDTGAMLRSAISQLNRIAPRPDLVLMTGDLAAHGEVEAYAHLREILAELQMQYLVIGGNHDDAENLRAAFHDHNYLPAQGFIQYAVDDYPLRIVAVDTVVRGQVLGSLCDTRLAWLDRTLGEKPSTPTLLMMHHAPFVTGLAHSDELCLERVEELERVISRHPQIERILCGHVHRAVQVRFGGTFASSCPSTAHQSCLDLRENGKDMFTLEPPGFQLHRWHNQRLFTYTLNVGTFEGPFPFH
ncbi:MAG TPA: phosphodiesterase [Ramlibacter sp.]|nr:phosphodiesterase [Ramlibacter sp.]